MPDDNKTTEVNTDNIKFDENGIPDQSFSDPFENAEPSAIDDLLGDKWGGDEYPEGEYNAQVTSISIKAEDAKAFLKFVTDDESGCFEGMDTNNLGNKVGQDIFKTKMKVLAIANGIAAEGKSPTQVFNLLSKAAGETGLTCKIKVKKRSYTNKTTGELKEVKDYKILGTAFIPTTEGDDDLPF